MAAVEGVHWGLEALLSVAVGAVGWVVKGFREDHKELENKHDEFVAEATRTFARRDDMRDALSEVKAQYREMNQKLDRLIERR